MQMEIESRRRFHVISIKPFISQMGKLRSGRKVPSAG
jgi:hypothetical protein